MKYIARFIDRLLIRAARWIGGPVHGLPGFVDVDVLPEYVEPRRMPPRGGDLRAVASGLHAVEHA